MQKPTFKPWHLIWSPKCCQGLSLSKESGINSKHHLLWVKSKNKTTTTPKMHSFTWGLWHLMHMHKYYIKLQPSNYMYIIASISIGIPTLE